MASMRLGVPTLNSYSSHPHLSPHLSTPLVGFLKIPSMETHQIPSPTSSPNTSSSSSSNVVSPPPPSPSPTPRSFPQSDTNPYPTTFIQADSASFKKVVQMLTGSTETAAKHAAMPPKSPVAARPPGPKKPSFKLYERRGSFRHLKMINPLANTQAVSYSPRKQPELLSPSILDLPSLTLSPVTPLIPDPFHRCSAEEERAIAEKGFYLHPSPRSTTPRDEPPRLLPLFPLTSPRSA